MREGEEGSEGKKVALLREKKRGGLDFLSPSSILGAGLLFCYGRRTIDVKQR
jgi:hypothetical protein